MWCGLTGCTNIMYTAACDTTQNGCATVRGFGDTAFKAIFGTTNQSDTLAAAIATQFDPVLWITNANRANLLTPMYLSHGTGDALVPYNLSVSLCSCGSGPMNTTVAVSMLAALSTPINGIRDIGYNLCANGAITCGGHESAMFSANSDPVIRMVNWVNGDNNKPIIDGVTLK